MAWVRNNRGNVFVGNLPREFSDEQLAETFDPYGIVLSASVARDPSSGERLRYGFVDIATERAATAAITALNGTDVGGSKLNVKMSERPAKKPAGAGPPRRQPMRRAATPRPELRERPDRPTDADVAVDSPAERPFQVQVIRRRQPNFQVERRPLPRRF